MKRTVTIVSLATIFVIGGFSRVGATDITACGSFGPGSYVVKQNIAAPAGTNCLVVTGPATIDLSGFTITGSGAAHGVFGKGAGALTVRNGTLSGFARGILANGTGSVIDGVRALAGSANGFTVGTGGTVKNSYVSGHQGGIVAGDNAVLSNDTFTDNTLTTGDGGTLGNNAQVSGSVFVHNSGNGLTIGDNATITHCAFAHNANLGLKAGSNAVVSFSSATNNASHGIQTFGGATVSNDTSSNNGAAGFEGLSANNSGYGLSSYTSNSATGNNWSGFNVSQAILVNNVASLNSGFGFGDSGFSTYQSNTAISNKGDNFHSSWGSTFTGNTATNSVTGAGFAVVCPTSLIGNTAQQNPTGNYVVYTYIGPGACTLANNLF